MLALMGEHKPAQVRATLANTTITDCCALVEEADCFFLAGQHQSSTSSGFSTYATVVPGFDLTASAPATVPIQDATDFTTAALPSRRCQEHGMWKRQSRRQLSADQCHHFLLLELCPGSWGLSAMVLQGDVFYCLLAEFPALTTHLFFRGHQAWRGAPHYHHRPPGQRVHMQACARQACYHQGGVFQYEVPWDYSPV